MINGLSGFDFSSFFAGLGKSRGGQPPGRGLQPMPGYDTVQFSRVGQNLAREGGVAATRNFRVSVANSEGNAASFGGGQAANFSRNPDGSISAEFRGARAVAVQTEAGTAVIRASRTVNVERSPNGTAVASYQQVQAVQVVRPAETSPAPTTRPVEEGSFLDRMKASFFTSKGDARYDAALDLNSDGTINHGDLAVLAEQSEQAPGPKSILERVESAFFTRAGEANFDASADVNGDGAVNFADLAMVREKMESGDSRPTRPIAPAEDESVAAPEQPRVNPGQEREDLLQRVRNAFFTGSGNESFDAGADLNGDGRVNFADLAELRERDQQG